MSEAERIVAAAIRVEGMTVTMPPPARHRTILKAFWNVNRKILVKPSDQGFTTDTGRYVERAEALKIAKAASQMIRWSSGPDPMHLFSEDLW